MDILNPAFCRIRSFYHDIKRRRTSQPASGRLCSATESHQTANVAPHKGRVAPGKPRGKKASSAERRPKSQKAAKQAKPAAGAREGSKAAKVLRLLRRPDGVSLKEANEGHGLVGAFCPWIPERHSRLVWAKSENGERRYSVQG
jgi:hypothetical protein